MPAARKVVQLARKQPPCTLTPEEAREWHDRCKWLIGQYGSLMGIVDALVERTEDTPSKRERDRIEALLLNAFEVWKR